MIYLLGGQRTIGDEVVASMKKEIKVCNRIAFIPTAADREALLTEDMANVIKLFQRIGFSEVSGTLILEEDSIKQIQDKMNEADMVCLMGGDPVSQMTFIVEKGMTDLLKGYKGVIVGFSAGAVNLSKQSLVIDAEMGSETGLYEGLDMVGGISVSAHYEANSRLAIDSLQIGHSIQKVYGIPESSGLLYKEEELNFLGKDPISLLIKGLPAMTIKYFEE